jgi:hypothetical protein
MLASYKPTSSTQSSKVIKHVNIGIGFAPWLSNRGCKTPQVTLLMISCAFSPLGTSPSKVIFPVNATGQRARIATGHAPRRSRSRGAGPEMATFRNTCPWPIWCACDAAV